MTVGALYSFSGPPRQTRPYSEQTDLISPSGYV